MIRFCKNQMALCLLYNAILVYDITGNSIVWYIYKYYKKILCFMHSNTAVKILQTGSTFAVTHSAPYVEAYLSPAQNLF